MKKTVNRLNYKATGVDIAAGEKAVGSIRKLVRRTYNQNVLSELGSFGGLYRFDPDSCSEPILVASTDGVGTKLRIALLAGVYDTVGQDLVNHCVNDILVQGASPLFFLDYIGLGKMDAAVVKQIIFGMVKACRENSCALIGGEMAEMPGIYHGQDFDLVGTIVGVVDKADLLPAQRISKGDILLGLPSSGLHTNGFSLVRRIVFDQLKLKVDSLIPALDATLGELLLPVHISYLPVLKPFLKDQRLHGLAHITGGGIPGNLKRIVPDGLAAYVSYHPGEYPPLFRWLQEAGRISHREMLRAFNLGIGMIVVAEESLAAELIPASGARIIGEINEARENKDKVVLLK